MILGYPWMDPLITEISKPQDICSLLSEWVHCLTQCFLTLKHLRMVRFNESCRDAVGDWPATITSKYVY